MSSSARSSGKHGASSERGGFAETGARLARPPVGEKG